MNVVVIAAHGLNCHWLGPYGNESINTPAFDSLAGESVLFDHHFADDPSPAGFANTIPSPLLGRLNDVGCTTVLLDDRQHPQSDDRPWQATVRTDPASHATPGDALHSALKSALHGLSRRPTWLLWIETDRLVPPWDFEFETYQQYAEESGGFIEERSTEGEEPIDEPATGPVDPDDESLRNRLYNSFAAAVTAFDAEVAGMVDLFRKAGLDRSAAWVFTSGYGWPLGEHGIIGPAGSRMHEELVHLPLVVRLPGARDAMRRVSAFTQTADLAPTIQSLFDLSDSGPSLRPLVAGTTGAGRAVCRISTRRDGRVERGLRTPDWAFLAESEGRPARLYRKPDDIWEVNDLSFRHADECDELTALLNEEEHP